MTRRPVPAGFTRSSIDGHRIIATVQGGVVRLSSRPGNDATKRFASVAEWLRQLPASTAIIDGEVAVPDERGVTHIDNLSETRHAPERLAFFAFDLLWLNGEDLRRSPLIARKARLAKLLGPGRTESHTATVGTAMADSSSTRSESSAGKALSRKERMHPIHPDPPQLG
jgi:bifunctional non-homologous end joining protein LigD